MTEIRGMTSRLASESHVAVRSVLGVKCVKIDYQCKYRVVCYSYML